MARARKNKTHKYLNIPRLKCVGGFNPHHLMKTKFKDQPICELTGGPVEFFVYQNRRWIFSATNAPEFANDYSVEIGRFFRSPSSTVDWLAHLHEKAWFQENDFLDMLDRFRTSTGSFGHGGGKGP